MINYNRKRTLLTHQQRSNKIFLLEILQSKFCRNLAGVIFHKNFKNEYFSLYILKPSGVESIHRYLRKWLVNAYDIILNTINSIDSNKKQWNNTQTVQNVRPLLTSCTSPNAPRPMTFTILKSEAFIRLFTMSLHGFSSTTSRQGWITAIRPDVTGRTAML